MSEWSGKHLIWFCTSLQSLEDAGLPISRSLEVLAGQAPTPRLGRALMRVRMRVEEGSSFGEALAADRRFPSLMVQLVDAGEASGMLDRMLGELGRFYEFRRSQVRMLISRIFVPVVYYVLAVAIISFVNWITAYLNEQPSSVLPWLLTGYALPVVLFIGYRLVVRNLGATRACHEVMLRIPVLGNVMRTGAIMRFSLVLYLMYEAGLPITEALTRAFRASGNGAFAARAPQAVAAIEKSGTLTDALRVTGLFPFDYMNIIAVAEESGKLSERLDWLARDYAGRSERALGMLVTAIAVLIWVCVAAFIIVYIFRFFMQYVGMITGAMP